MGGGLGLFAGSSHALVTEKTRIAMPEITIALYPDVGGSWFLNRMPGKCGLFVALTAAPLNAADAMYAGLARYFADSARKQELLSVLRELPWQDSDQHNQQLLSEHLDTLVPGKAVNPDGGELAVNLAEHRALIDRVCAGDSLAKVVDGILGVESADAWWQKAQANLAHGSPIAANTIWQQLRRRSGLSLEEVFAFELMISTNVVRHPEFAEGVRALLIDKDKLPRWQYERVDQVPEALMTQFFSPPWEHNPLADLGGAK